MNIADALALFLAGFAAGACSLGFLVKQINRIRGAE